MNAAPRICGLDHAVGGLLYQHGIHIQLGPLGALDLGGPAACVLVGLVIARGLQFALSLCLLMPTAGPAKPAGPATSAAGTLQQQGPLEPDQGTLGQLLCDRHVLMFLFSMGVNGVAGATYDNYVILFAKETLHADGAVLGLMTTATGVANTAMWAVQVSASYDCMRTMAAPYVLCARPFPAIAFGDFPLGFLFGAAVPDQHPWVPIPAGDGDGQHRPADVAVSPPPHPP